MTIHKRRQKAFIDYDIEATYTEHIDAEDNRIKSMLDRGDIKSVYATKTIKAGKVFEVEIYPEFTKAQAAAAGVKKKNKQAQKKLNDKNARKYLERLINANFGNGDYWATFTYSNEHKPDSVEAAQKDMKNYIGRVNYHRKKQGKPPAKYIYITEYGEKTGRVHHHLIIDNGLSMDELERLWKKGSRNNIRRISEDENGIAGLANYLTKDPQGRKRWKSSKGLKKPVERKSYSIFKYRRIRKMIENHDNIKIELEKQYKGKRLINAEVRYNKHNGRFYIYAKMIN